MIEIIETLNTLFAVGVALPVLFFAGIYLSFKLKFIQVTRLHEGVAHLFAPDTKSKGNASNFEVISAVVAGNLGTGNISGTAVALSMGGPGAIVWMWVMALFGAVLKFMGCYLGILYRTKNDQGEYVGGPMYYLRDGMRNPTLAALFCVLAVLTALTVGNLVQINSIALPLQEFGVSPLLTGGVMAAAVALVLAGGMRRFTTLAGKIVPAMAVLYLGAAFTILALYASAVPSALYLMLHSAINPTAALGGAAGFGVLKAIGVGFERGVFATDAGTGIAPILQSEARTEGPEEEGLVAMVAPFFVTFVVTITALVLIVTGAYQTEGLQSTQLCTQAFAIGLGGPAKGIVTLTLILFAFTTILAWAACAERCLQYLGGKRSVLAFNLLFVLLIPVGALCKVTLVWALADLAITLMLLVNVVGVIGLSKRVLIARPRPCTDV